MCFVLRMRDLGVCVPLPARDLGPSERVLPRARVDGLPSPLALRADPERCAVPVRPGGGDGDGCGVCRAGWPSSKGHDESVKGMIGGSPGGTWVDETMSTLSESLDGADSSSEWPSAG